LEPRDCRPRNPRGRYVCIRRVCHLTVYLLYLVAFGSYRVQSSIGGLSQGVVRRGLCCFQLFQEFTHIAKLLGNAAMIVVV
jgi:hypothetical protein